MNALYIMHQLYAASPQYTFIKHLNLRPFIWLLAPPKPHPPTPP